MDALEETKYIVSKRCPQCGLPLREHQAKIGELIEDVRSCSRCKRMWTMVNDQWPCEQKEEE